MHQKCNISANFSPNIKKVDIFEIYAERAVEKCPRWNFQTPRKPRNLPTKRGSVFLTVCVGPLYDGYWRFQKEDNLPRKSGKRWKMNWKIIFCEKWSAPLLPHMPELMRFSHLVLGSQRKLGEDYFLNNVRFQLQTTSNIEYSFNPTFRKQPTFAPVVGLMTIYIKKNFQDNSRIEHILHMFCPEYFWGILLIIVFVR